MNFLGHIYFSGDDFDLAIANLFGDFTKGKKYEQFPEIVQRGVLLHRSIDQFIDHHEKVVKLVYQLQPELPKVASVAVDLYFDHLLAKHWAQFHTKDLADYLKEFYAHIVAQKHLYPTGYQQFLEKMEAYNWMIHYAELDGLKKMCDGINRRLSFESALTNGVTVFLNNQPDIESTFFAYMKDAKSHFFVK